MKELAAALRQFADAIEAGSVMPHASMAAVVVADDQGVTKTTYIGKVTPPESTCIILLARGVQQMVERAQQVGAKLSGGVTRGSTH